MGEANKIYEEETEKEYWKKCFAYRESRNTEYCSALKALYCKYGKGKCKFFKTKQDFCGRCPSKYNNPTECRMKCIPSRRGKKIF